MVDGRLSIVDWEGLATSQRVVYVQRSSCFQVVRGLPSGSISGTSRHAVTSWPGGTSWGSAAEASAVGTGASVRELSLLAVVRKSRSATRAPSALRQVVAPSLRRVTCAS